MLGSFFDLPKEVAAIAAKRQLREREAAPAPRTNVAYDEFDRRIHDFVKALTPDAPADEANRIIVDRDR